MAFSLKNLAALIKVAAENKASDIHIRTDEVPCLRIKGDLVPVQTKVFTAQDVSDIVKILIHDEEKLNFVHKKIEVDGAFQIPDLCRLRYNLFHYFGSIGIVLRIINSKVPTLKELDQPKVVARVATSERGLVLVTGATGSGKSTTLASMIDHINSSKPTHIITIEDPIQFVHKSKKSLINQREVGGQTKSFARALKSALREDPDCILVGEMRDLETIRLALTAAETGHLVFGTLHTSSAAKTIDRVVDVFPAAEKDMVRAMLSESLQAVISQTLCKTKDGQGRVAAHEIMLGTPAIRNLIREGKVRAIGASNYSAPRLAEALATSARAFATGNDAENL